MRRTVAVVCIALGVFCLVLAPLLRFWMASAVMKTPMDQYSQSVNRGEDVTYFSIEELELIEGATVEANTTLRADVAASDDDTVVWDQFTWVRDVERDFAILSSSRRTGHDRVTGEAVDCCDAAVNDESPVQGGQAFKWPFLVEQRDYEFFDTTTQRVLPMEFEGTEPLRGFEDIEAYKFVQVVEPTKIGERDFPRSLLGIEGEGDVTADVVASNTRTYWVDPVTGVPLNISEDQRQVATVQGEERLVMFAGELSYTDDSIADSVETASAGDQVVLIRDTLPLVLLVAGGLLFVLGLVLYATGGNRGHSRRH